jgi:hypothetical protein
MSLPGLNFDEWQAQNDPNHSQSEVTRAEVKSVAKYYADYVRLMKLEKFFKNDTVVFKIAQVKRSDKNPQSEIDNAQWIVHGFDKVSKKVFVVACKRIVLANGCSDLANHLGVKGEMTKGEESEWKLISAPVTAVLRAYQRDSNILPSISCR